MAKKLLLLGLIFLLCILSLTGCGSSTKSKSTEGTTAVPQDYPNAGLLVSAASVQNNASNMILIDARGAGYTTAHIPGAINLKHSDYWTAGTGLKPLATLQTMLGNSGLRRDMIFVIYDNTTAAWGAAGRIFWMLEYLGCGDVHILNGGWDKWVADGRATETTVNTLPATTFTASVNTAALATKDYLLSKLSNTNFAIIDAREDEEYNGWTLYGETRGGHIRGAVSINYKWFFNTDKTVLGYSNLKNLLESRGITTDKEVSSYCTAGIRSGFVYFALRLMGYPRISNYDASMYEWSANPTCPMNKMPNYHKLVHTGWVQALIAGGNPGTAATPPTYQGNGYVILEVQSSLPYETSADYDAGHIPGAIHSGPCDLEAGVYYPYYYSPADGALLPNADLQAAIENWGIKHDTTVVVYGAKTGTAVFRVAWMLMYAGAE